MTHSASISRRLRALLGLLLLVSCTRPAAVPVTADRATAPSSAPREEPLVLIATSAHSCDDGNQVQIGGQVDEDQRLLQAAFGKGSVSDDDLLLDLATVAEGKPMPAIRGRAFVLIYSGHAAVTRVGERDTTHLCLGAQQRLSTDALFQWIQAQAPKWAVVILNGCETAQVNPAIVAWPPIAVISASPSVVTPSLPPEVAGSTEPVGTDFIRTLVDLVREAHGVHAALLDTNCDGFVSDRELFYPLEARLRQHAWTRADALTALPVPKLRRNSSVPLPFLRSACLASDEERLLPELSTSIAAERATVAAGELPRTRHWHFLLNSVKDHLACIRGQARGDLASLCEALAVEFEPVPLSGAELSDSKLREALTALAKRAVSTEIYWLEFDYPWAQLRRLRDDAIVGVSHTTNVAELVPHDRRMVLNGEASGTTWRYDGTVSWTELTLQAAVPVVCQAPEGQCFHFPSESTLATHYWSEP